MKRTLACLILAGLLGSAQAADAQKETATGPAAVLEVSPGRQVYAFEQPEILVRQRLFGLAHGLSLLAAACLDMPEHSGPVQDAYAIWHAKQRKTIEALVRDLSVYYFGPRANEAQWPDLVRALKLPDSIQPALRDVSLTEACATLPEAMVRPRYALDQILVQEPPSAESQDAAARPKAPRFAVSPTPTIERLVE